jgi:SpoIID/LytB domain protein
MDDAAGVSMDADKGGNALSDSSASEDERPERVRMIVESAPGGADMERPSMLVSVHHRFGRPHLWTRSIEHMSLLPRRWSAVALVALVTTVLIGAPPAPGAPPDPAAAAVSGDSVTFVGHGWGHGRGMGQYGAYGYAIDQGWSYDAILAHFYGGTTLAGDAGNPAVSIELTALTGGPTTVQGPGLTVDGAPVGDTAVEIVPDGQGNFLTLAGPGCGGPWRQVGPALASGLQVRTADGIAVTCGPTKLTGYRGAVEVVNGNGVQYALNITSADEYLFGVVPREMPASWASGGGGRGAQAVRAQAVAARSYALGSSPRPASGATTCDTTACQVYGGYSEVPYSTGVYKALEDSRTNEAVQATSGQMIRAADSSIARTEFSSSTGGWTAGGEFPAVEDTGDATVSNTNHTWTASFSPASVAAALGVGPIRSITVTERNGLGAEGGRVLSVLVTETSGRATSFSGDTVRLKLGLKSDWFSISSTWSTAEA